MSDSIRRYIYDYVCAHLTDRALENIRAGLMLADGAHKIPVTLKVNFEVDKDGIAKISAGMATNLKIPAWDVPMRMEGQLDLFHRVDPLPPTQPLDFGDRASTPVEAVHPPQLNMIPDEELSEPGLAPGLPDDYPTGPTLPLINGAPPGKAKQILSQINKANEEFLEKYKRGEIRDDQLTPDAQAAVKEMLKE